MQEIISVRFVVTNIVFPQDIKYKDALIHSTAKTNPAPFHHKNENNQKTISSTELAASLRVGFCDEWKRG